MAGLIVHEWFEQFGGAEKVVEEFAALFPDARIACLWDDYPQRFAGRSVTESWLARTPLRKNKSLALPFMLPTWRSLNVEPTPEWMLCSSHLFAHHAQLQAPDVRKYVYAYTPARYIWNPELDQRGSSAVVRLAALPLQKLDRARSHEATSIACVSHLVRDRIREAWGCDASVIYPPVDVEYFSANREHELNEPETDIVQALTQPYVLGASRFIPYKRLDLVIEFGEVNGIPVVLAGGGPEEARLRSLAAAATVPVSIVPRPSRALLRELYSRALAYVFPALEDFGIMPVEAAATGTPVIANVFGGAAETVVTGTTGVLLEGFSKVEMRAAAELLPSISSDECRRRAGKFDRAVFRNAIEEWMTTSN